MSKSKEELERENKELREEIRELTAQAEADYYDRMDHFDLQCELDDAMERDMERDMERAYRVKAFGAIRRMASWPRYHDQRALEYARKGYGSESIRWETMAKVERMMIRDAIQSKKLGDILLERKKSG